ALYRNAPCFLAELRKRSAAGRHLEEQAPDVKVLCLDDLGAEKPSDWVRECLLAIIDKRINHHLPTIYTSNYDAGQLHIHLGDPTGRIADRIIGSCRVVFMDGPSFRIQSGRERQARLFGGEHVQ
ncbi:MAG: ATP-binding protein, partial [Deltaproteobacteria bacterium]|nr:ATP-binding protein [Deltaproteobacteria bacterium]